MHWIVLQHFWPLDKRHWLLPGCVLRSAAGCACALPPAAGTKTRESRDGKGEQCVAAIKARIMCLPQGEVRRQLLQFGSNCQEEARFCRELGSMRPDSHGAIPAVEGSLFQRVLQICR